jgi:hypothetical protein
MSSEPGLADLCLNGNGTTLIRMLLAVLAGSLMGAALGMRLAPGREVRGFLTGERLSL